MKEYIQGNKRLRVQKVKNGVRFDFWNNGLHTYYIKPVEQYKPFLDYLKMVWLGIGVPEEYKKG